jgi:hypothetical protein
MGYFHARSGRDVDILGFAQGLLILTFLLTFLTIVFSLTALRFFKFLLVC